MALRQTSRRGRSAFTVLLLAAAAACAGCGKGDKSSAATSGGQDGAALEEAGRWVEAAEAWEADALRRGPASWDEPLRRAFSAYAMANRPEAAQRLAAEVLARSPASHEVLYYLGDSERVLLHYDEARGAFERLLAAEPSHLLGTLALAHVLSRLGRPAEALPLLERCLASPSMPHDFRMRALVERSRVARRLGKLASAADDLAEVLENDPHDTVALSECAQTLALLGKKQLADGARDHHAWLFGRGHQLSTEDESKLFSTGPASRTELARRAFQAADRREFLRATEELEKLAAETPAEATIAAPLARLWTRLLRFEDAVRIASAARAAGLVSPSLLRLEADAHRALGRLDAARASIRAASDALANPARSGPAAADDSGDAAGGAGAHVRAGQLALEPPPDLDAAAMAFGRARAAAPGDWRGPLGLARVELERGNVGQSMELLRAARELLPADGALPAEYRRWLGVSRGLAGDLRSAAREIMALIVEDPSDLESFRAFARVFGAKKDEPEVASVLQLERRLEEKIAAREATLRALAAAPLRDCAGAFVEQGENFVAEGATERALDCFLLAADLDPGTTAALKKAEALLRSPGRTFERLRELRRILARAPDDAFALESLVQAYCEAGLRLEEAEKLAVRLVQTHPGAASQALLAEVRRRRSS
jgi:tetratricopeptide (TPR) repeat protein